MNTSFMIGVMASLSADMPVSISRGRHRDTHKLRTKDMVRKANRKRNKAARAANAKRIRLSR